MNKVNVTTINNIKYIQISELCKLQPKDTNLYKSPYYIITKFNFIKNKDFFFFKNVDDSWISADGSAKRQHKVFFLLSVVAKFKSLIKFVNYNNTNNYNTNTNNTKNTDNGAIFDVETRGIRKYNQIFFRVNYVANCFNIKDLRKIVSNNQTSYTKGTDYIYINTFKTNNSMFFTYTGLIRCLFVSRSKVVSNFIDWSMKTLFIAQFGNKYEDISKI